LNWAFKWSSRSNRSNRFTAVFVFKDQNFWSGTLCFCAFSVSLPENGVIGNYNITFVGKIARVSFTVFPQYIRPAHPRDFADAWL
jgi:hypothetical protein